MSLVANVLVTSQVSVVTHGVNDPISATSNKLEVVPSTGACKDEVLWKEEEQQEFRRKNRKESIKIVIIATLK